MFRNASPWTCMQPTMKLVIAILTLSSVSIVVSATSAPPASSLNPLIRINVPTVALTHVTLFDGSERPAKHDQTVVIDHGKITAGGPTPSFAIPPGAHLVGGSGKTPPPRLIRDAYDIVYI